MAWTREQKNAYEKARCRRLRPLGSRPGKGTVLGRPKQHKDEKPILPQEPFSALYTTFFINRNPKK